MRRLFKEDGLQAEFEVRHKDLLGRIGYLRIGGKKVETPAFVPVINPVNQVIPPREIKQIFGCNIVITNAYILLKRFGREAVDRGVHGIIDFDGIVMTDSGGYQVLMYGDVDAQPSEIAVFQESIGSDIAVPLDKPTGLVTRKKAEQTVEKTLENVRLTMNLVGEKSRCVWVGPIQGGVYRDLIQRCVEEYKKLGFSLYCLGSPTPLMTSYRYTQLVSMITAARAALRPVTPLHLFGAGHPMIFGLVIALGVDLFDSASYVLFAKEDRYMTPDGTLRLEDLAYLPCSCETCVKVSAKELKEMERDERLKHLALHNLHVCFQELKTVKQAIWEGRLFELVEKRAKAHPSVYDAFVEVFSDDITVNEMALHTSVSKRRGIFLTDLDSLRRPEYRKMADKLDRFLRPENDVAVLLHHRTVTSRNITHVLEKISKTLDSVNFDVYVVGTPYGLVPLFIHNVYPVSQTSFSITLFKQIAETLNSKAAKKLAEAGYRKIYVFEWGPDTYPGYMRELAQTLSVNTGAEIIRVNPRKQRNQKIQNESRGLTSH